MSMAFVAFLGHKIYRLDGPSDRHVMQINNSLNSGLDGGAGVRLDQECGIEDSVVRNKFQMCLKDSRGSIKYALVGDSKAYSIFPGLVRTSNEAGRWLAIGGNSSYGAPLPVISDSEVYKKNMPLSQIAIDSIARNKEIKKVIFASSTRALFALHNDTDINDLTSSKYYNAALDGLKSSIKILIDAKKKVIILVDNPTLPHPEDCLNRITAVPYINKLLIRPNLNCKITLERHLLLSYKYRLLLNEVQAAYPNDVQIFDTTKYFCDEMSGICGPSKDGRSLYSFTDHMSDFAAGLIGRDLNVFLAK